MSTGPRLSDDEPGNRPRKARLLRNANRHQQVPVSTLVDGLGLGVGLLAGQYGRLERRRAGQHGDLGAERVQAVEQELRVERDLDVVGLYGFEFLANCWADPSGLSMPLVNARRTGVLRSATSETRFTTSTIVAVGTLAWIAWLSGNSERTGGN